jgi:uncharacterized circularly permuted ATP-grasp superfamily protein
VKPTPLAENLSVSSPATATGVHGYKPDAPYWDELFERDGTARPVTCPLVDVLSRLGPDGLMEAGRRRDALFMQQGITFETAARARGRTKGRFR